MAAEFLKARVQPQMQLLRSSVEVPSIGKVLESNYPVNICNYIHMYVCVRARTPLTLLTSYKNHALPMIELSELILFYHVLHINLCIYN